MMSQADARELFEYVDGALLWRKNPKGRKTTNPAAGTVNSSGYRIITVKGKKLHAHRLVWSYFHGWPEFWIDHINRDPLDNRIENLRPATRESNCHNSGLRSDNESGVKGLSWCNTYNKWVMQIYSNGKKYSQRFKDFDEGKEFTEFLREQLHGEFACTGAPV